MASTAIYIQDKPYRDGTVGVYLRMTIDRKSYLHQLCKVSEANIDRKKKVIKKAEPGYIGLNLLISRYFANSFPVIKLTFVKK